MRQICCFDSKRILNYREPPYYPPSRTGYRSQLAVHYTPRIKSYRLRYQSPVSSLSSIPRASSGVPFTRSVYIQFPSGRQFVLKKVHPQAEGIKTQEKGGRRRWALNRPWKWLDPSKVNFHDRFLLSSGLPRRGPGETERERRRNATPLKVEKIDQNFSADLRAYS